MKITLDRNVLLRLVMRDDEAQGAAAIEANGEGQPDRDQRPSPL